MTRLLAVVVCLMTAAELATAGTIAGNVAGGGADSVVYVDSIPGKAFPAPAQHPVMDQKSLSFQPHVLVIQQGTTVDFLNSDSVSHNVFWASIGGNKKLAHNLGTWPQGQTKSFRFDNPGAVPVFCNVHPEMSAFIVVSPTPYFAKTDSGGNYKIDNIPDGNYTVVVWHDHMKPSSKPVTVSGVTKADLAIAK